MTQGETARIHLWLTRLHAGDASALNDLIAHFEHRLRALTRKMLREFPAVHSCEQTDDVFQNAVIRLARALRSTSPPSTRDLIRLSAAQVRRELLNLARHYQSRPIVFSLSATFTPSGRDIGSLVASERLSAAAYPATSGGTEALERWTEFHEAAASLPEEQREVFDLLWYHGLTQLQAAEVQGVSERTVRKRWNSARLMMHDLLGGQLPVI